MKPNENAVFNRGKPLLERKHVPCEVLMSKDRGSRPTSKRRNTFTLRVLQGHRVSNQGTTSERVIRIELSNEYEFLHREEAKKVKQKPQINDRNQVFGQRFPFSQGPIHIGSLHQPTFEEEDTDSNINSGLEDIERGNSNNIQLYELELGESDFQKLQQDQALLVNFSDFSKSFIELLSMCDLGQDKEEKNEVKLSSIKMSDDQGSKFMCRIEEFQDHHTRSSWNGGKENRSSAARFSIVESNQFRELIHLSLDIDIGSDETVRKYLSSRLKDTLGQNSLLSFQLRNEKQKSDEVDCAYSELSKQYNELLSISERERTTIARKADDSIQQHNTQRMEELRHLTRLKDEEIACIKKEKEDCIRRLQEELEKAVNTNKTLVEENNAKSESISRISQEYEQCQGDLRMTKQELERVHVEVKILKNERDDLTTQVQHWKAEIKELESSNYEYHSRLDESQSELETTKQYTKESLQEKEIFANQIQTMKQEIFHLQAELNRNQDLLGRYQKDRREIKKKLKARTDMIKTQEFSLNSKDERLREMQADLNKKEGELESIQSELSTTQCQLKETNDKLLEKERALISNQQVISFLNREANKSRIPTSVPPIPTVISHPNTIRKTLKSNYCVQRPMQNFATKENTFLQTPTRSRITPDNKSPYMPSSTVTKQTVSTASTSTSKAESTPVFSKVLSMSTPNSQMIQRVLPSPALASRQSQVPFPRPRMRSPVPQPKKEKKLCSS
ncbi:hypothetical protein CTEN210_14269 [Chaetoceros tenuissimus]|uniref:Spindle assembly abnormal protein 6 N-terminal domain-containing protein n=1 Tax=Chaetoceros tenuissimus TaxID=426638 RepID=A0AAD3D4V4_9STRA|nr:hypothetical protein CTEN210_14269 [Chaetoceros tenuissimus]